MNIVIFAPFTYFDRAYSLSGIVQDQIKMFVQEGNRVKTLVAKGMHRKEEFELEGSQLIEAIVPGNPQETYQNIEKGIFGAEWVIVHDVAWVEYNEWLDTIFRKLEKEHPKVGFVHQIHSAPGTETCPPHRKARNLNNVYYVFGNESWREKLARYIGDELDHVHTVRYTHGLWDQMAGEGSEALYDRLGLFDVDLVGFYPAHPMPGKNLPAILDIMAEFKRRNFYTFKYVFTVNGCPEGSAAHKRVEEYKQKAKDLGIAENVVWMNEYPEWRQSVPYDVVQKLWKITDIFINPSQTEVNSLMTIEAMAHKCMVVANFDCPPVVEQLGREEDGHKYNGGVFHAFGNHETGIRPQNADMVTAVVHMMEMKLRDGVALSAFRRAKQLYNPRRIYREEWIPLLSRTWDPITEVKVDESPARPQVSIIIPIMNLTEELVQFTHRAIRSVRKYPSTEVILVQNHPEDENDYDCDLMITNTHNVGVAKAWNQGLSKAVGDYVAIMNSDVVMPDDWFEQMKPWADKGGMVFPWVREKCVGNGEGRIPDDKFKFPDTHGSFFLARREVFRKVGPFDDHFFAYGEDKDYWKRCVLAGVPAFRANVHSEHVMNATSGTASEQRKLVVEGQPLTLTELLERNAKYYQEKWGEPL